ncbi:MAG: hypothetical protein V4722_02955 [Bacteroidota bacterium]
MLQYNGSGWTPEPACCFQQDSLNYNLYLDEDNFEQTVAVIFIRRNAYFQKVWLAPGLSTAGNTTQYSRSK